MAARASIVRAGELWVPATLSDPYAKTVVVGIPAGSTCCRSRRTPMTYRSTSPTEVGGIGGGTRRGLRYLGIVDGSSMLGPPARRACTAPPLSMKRVAAPAAPLARSVRRDSVLMTGPRYPALCTGRWCSPSARLRPVSTSPVSPRRPRTREPMGQTARMSLPDPALVVLVGASGSGKSTWAAQRYRAEEVVSSDALRGVVGSGPHDLDASADAFAVLEAIVAARLGRRLTTVVDTLGLDADRRRGWLAQARAAGLPAVARAARHPRRRVPSPQRRRDRPLPGSGAGRTAAPSPRRGCRGRGRGVGPRRPVSRRPSPPPAPTPGREPRAAADRTASTGVEVVLQVSRFPWGEDPLAWLRDIALAADEAGFAGLALMDHLIQIPQVGRAWDPIPEPWVTLGAVAALGTRLRLGTLCTPVTFRRPGITAKAAATLSALTGGRRSWGSARGGGNASTRHTACPSRRRGSGSTTLERAIRVMRALWAPGTKAVLRCRGVAARDHLLPTPGGPYPRGRRREGRATHPADRGGARRRVQPDHH